MTEGAAGERMNPSSGPLPSRPLDWVLTIICAGLARNIAEMEEALARHENKEEENLDILADVRRRVRDVQARYERWRWVPFLNRSLHAALMNAREPLKRIKDEIQRSRREADDIRKSLAKTVISYDMLIMLGQREYSVPDPMPLRTKNFLRRFDELNRSGLVQENIHELASALSEILGDWAAASLLYIQSKKPIISVENEEERESCLVFDKARGRFVETQAGYVKSITNNYVMRRIYLPVPRSWEAKMVQAGASIDDSAVNHVMSRVWIGFTDYERFEPHLPRSYRKVPPDLDFEALEIDMGGRSFAFSKHQRNRAIKEMGERQGWRCSLCGSYGGLVWDRLRDMRSAEMSEPLVLRPQWKFRLVNNDTAVAELTDLLLICRDCDLAFETGRLESLLRGKDGALAERVRVHVHRRRMMLLRCEETFLAAREKALERHLLSFAGVSQWILDLSRLPEFSSVFKDGIVAPEESLIVGLPILSEDGEELHPARSLDDILVEIEKKTIMLDKDMHNCQRENPSVLLSGPVMSEPGKSMNPS